MLNRDEEGEGKGEMCCKQQAGEARSPERKGQRDQQRESEFTREGNIHDTEADIYDTGTDRAHEQQIQLSQVVQSTPHP